MKATLNGIDCNTKAAVKVAAHDNGEFINNDTYLRETLYNGAYGQYFLHVFGGAKSPVAGLQAVQREAAPKTLHSIACCSTFAPDTAERMIALTKEEALQWIQSTQSTEVYNRILSETIAAA